MIIFYILCLIKHAERPKSFYFMVLNTFTEPIRKKSNRGYENRNRTEPWKSWTVPALININIVTLKCIAKTAKYISCIFSENIKFYEGFFINQSLYYKVKLSATWPSSVHWQHLDNSTFTWQYLEQPSALLRHSSKYCHVNVLLS